MAASIGSAARVLAAGYDLKSFLREFAVSGEITAMDVTTFSSSTGGAKEYIPGLMDSTMTCEGIYDDTDLTGIDYIANAITRQASQPWVYLPRGDVQGYRGVGLPSQDTKYEVKSPADGVNMVTFAAQSNKANDVILIHHILQIEGSNANSTSIDNAASSASGGVGYLQTTAVSAGTYTCKIQHSTDNSVWVDLITFSTLTAKSAQRSEVTGTVNRYTRSIWTVTGGSPTFHASFGRF